MNWEIVVAQNPLGIGNSTVYVDAPDVVTAIKAAEKYVAAETAANRPGDLLTISAKLADAQRIIKA